MPRPRGVGGSAEGAALMPVHESDVCIIGGGISAAMLALKLSELRPGISITVIEAGSKLFDLENRMRYRQRSIEYAENPWPGDFIEDQAAKGVISRTMAVGGSALHWGGTCNRFSEEDLRLKSMFGLYTDWPIEWAELEKFYCEAERRLGVSGEPIPHPEDRRSELRATISRVPSPTTASSLTTWNTTSPRRRRPCSRTTFVAHIAAASPPFLSVAPRPYTRPSTTAPPKGSCDHDPRSPTGTTSTWALKAMERPPPEPGRRATSTGCASKVAEGPTSQLSLSKPSVPRKSRTKPTQRRASSGKWVASLAWLSVRKATSSPSRPQRSPAEASTASPIEAPAVTRRLQPARASSRPPGRRDAGCARPPRTRARARGRT